MKQVKPAPYKLINAFEELSQEFVEALENVMYTSVGECTQEEVFRIRANLAVTVGEKYDTKLLIEHGINAEEMGKPTFGERTALWIKEKYGIEIESKKVQSVNRQTRQTGLLYVGITTDRALNLLVRSNKLNILGDFTFKLKWIHDCYCQKLWEYLMNRVDLVSIDKANGLMSQDDIKEAMANLNELSDLLPLVEFSDKDFRKVTGMRHLSGEEIKNLVLQYKELKVDGEVEVFFDVEKKEFQKIALESCPLAIVDIQDSGRVSNRNRKPVYKYIFRTSPYGLILIHNFLAHKFTKFPQEFYKLKRASQEIYRKIVQHKKSKFKIETLFQYIGYPENPSNWKAMMLLVENGLTELKDKKMIIDWKKEGSFKESQYKITRK